MQEAPFARPAHLGRAAQADMAVAGVIHAEMEVMRTPCHARNSRKKAAISDARAAGCSRAAKWPPLAIGVQRRISV